MRLAAALAARGEVKGQAKLFLRQIALKFGPADTLDDVRQARP